MPWVALSDDFYDDEKIVAAGPVCLAMYVVGLAWSVRNLQNGFVPNAKVRTLLDWQGTAWKMWTGELVGGGEDVDALDVAHDLVAHGLWEEVAGGFQIVNFLKYQPSREQVLEKREKDKQRKQQTRSGDSGGSRSGVRTDSPENPAAPLPLPRPLPHEKPPPPSSDSRARRIVEQAVVEAVQAEKAAGSDIRSVGAVAQSRLPAALLEHEAKVARWLDDYSLGEHEFVKHALGKAPASWSPYRVSRLSNQGENANG